MPPPRSTFPKVPVYLLYGDQVEEIMRDRDRILDQLLAPELRHEYMTEYTPGQKYGLELGDILGEISADVMTVSFLEDSPKVIVVTNPLEIYGSAARPKRPAKSKAKTKTKAKAKAESAEEGAVDPIVRWFAKSLPTSGNHIILQAFESEADDRIVDDRSPNELLQVIMRIGHTVRRREGQPAIFRIEEAILKRDLNELLRIIRRIWKAGESDTRLYSFILRSLRYLLQANIAREKGALRGDTAALAALLPDSPQTNILKASEYVSKKYLTPWAQYRTADLLRAYEGLMGAYNAMRPDVSRAHGGEIHVPDAQTTLERVVIDLLSSPPPRR